jgi:hypothetical protein
MNTDTSLSNRQKIEFERTIQQDAHSHLVSFKQGISPLIVPQQYPKVRRMHALVSMVCSNWRLF